MLPLSFENRSLLMKHWIVTYVAFFLQLLYQEFTTNCFEQSSTLQSKIGGKNTLKVYKRIKQHRLCSNLGTVLD